MPAALHVTKNLVPLVLKRLKNKEKIIGVLALQGCVDRHRPHIEAAGGVFRAVRTPADFAAADAFILPGGESTTMLKLIDNFALEQPLRDALAAKPAWGICAGAILMAKEVTHPAQKSFGLLPLKIRRNGYGRQLESLNVEIEGYGVSFIRAPVIEAAGNSGIEILARRDGAPVWLKTAQYMVTTFHPELALDFPSPMHKTFIDMVRA